MYKELTQFLCNRCCLSYPAIVRKQRWKFHQVTWATVELHQILQDEYYLMLSSGTLGYPRKSAETSKMFYTYSSNVHLNKINSLTGSFSLSICTLENKKKKNKILSHILISQWAIRNEINQNENRSNSIG